MSDSKIEEVLEVLVALADVAKVGIPAASKFIGASTALVALAERMAKGDMPTEEERAAATLLGRKSTEATRNSLDSAIERHSD